MSQKKTAKYLFRLQSKAGSLDKSLFCHHLAELEDRGTWVFPYDPDSVGAGGNEKFLMESLGAPKAEGPAEGSVDSAGARPRGEALPSGTLSAQSPLRPWGRQSH